MLVSAGNGVSFIRRTAMGNTSVSTTVAGMAAPRYIRLDRSGNTFTAYQSSDGTTWTQVGAPETISMPSSLLVGLAVTSHNNTTLTTATFDHVSASNGGGGGGGGGGGSLPAPWLQLDIGAVGVPGTGQDANGTMTVQGSGADIWGSADAFHYVYQPWSGDGSFVAFLASLTNTNSWAKAGVMIRATLDPGSVHAFALVSAGSGASFIRRTTANGTSLSTTTPGIAPPRWLRLDRSANSVIAYQSSDGTTLDADGHRNAPAFAVGVRRVRGDQPRQHDPCNRDVREWQWRVPGVLGLLTPLVPFVWFAR